MTKVLITGSNDGLGFLAAKRCVEEGAQVFLHARSQEKLDKAVAQIPGITGGFVADLSDIRQVQKLADQLNNGGPFDAIIHNAGVYQSSSEELFKVNVLAPYLLTINVTLPKRLIYLSSQMHKGGSFPKSINQITYSDSKLWLTMLMAKFSMQFPECYVNAVDPGWVPTKMGGKGAPDDLRQGAETQVWLATSNEPDALVTGKYFYHKKEQAPHSDVHNTSKQEELIELLSEWN